MKVALIGASGFVGAQVLKEALQRGHEVTAIVRDAAKITTQDARLTVKAVDVHNTEELAEIVAGHDAVVSAYNPGWQDPQLYDSYIVGSEAVQLAVKESGVKRFIVVGGAGSLEVAPGVQLVDTPEFPAEWKQGALAARDYLNTIRKEDKLDWTFVSPAIMLQPGQRTGKYRTATNNPIFNAENKSEISVEDLAVALIDELEQNNFIRQRFTAGY